MGVHIMCTNFSLHYHVILCLLFAIIVFGCRQRQRLGWLHLIITSSIDNGTIKETANDEDYHPRNNVVDVCHTDVLSYSHLLGMFVHRQVIYTTHLDRVVVCHLILQSNFISFFVFWCSDQTMCMLEWSKHDTLALISPGIIKQD
jgi:hypothetical protein